MSDDGPIDPLPPEIASLLAQAGDPPPLPPDVAERLLAGVDRRVARDGTQHERPRGWRRLLRSRALLAAASFALGCAAGAALARWRRPPAPPPQVIVRERVVERVVERATPPTVTAPRDAGVPQETAPTDDAGSRARRHEGDDDELAGEQRRLDAARDALGRGAYPDALAAIDDHARRYPRGQLAPERESLRVRALAAMGRADAARAAGERFMRRHGDTVFAAGVARALRALSADGGT